MTEPTAAEDPRATALLGFWLSLALAVTGAIWWNLAEGPREHVHPGIVGVVLTPLALLATLVFAVRLWRTRA